MAMPSVLVCGLGAMGGALAVRLLETGVDVKGYDIDEAAIQRFIDIGGKACCNLDTVSEYEVIITSLPNDEILRSFVNDKLLDRLERHQTLVEMSTVLPQTMVDIARQLEDKVKQTVDCPVSGGPNEAKRGALSLLVGVDGELEPFVETMLSKVGTINLIGGVGQGKKMKLINNAISLSNTAIMTEAFRLGQELGLDLNTMYRTLSKSGAASTMLTKRIPYAIDDDYSARFSVELAEKDTRLALQMAHEEKFPTPLLANVHQRYESAIRKGLGREDIVSLIKLD